MTERRSLSKNTYKLGLFILKSIPAIISICFVLYMILSYYGINCVALNYISGVSIITVIFIYIISYMLKFCEYHRIFLHYIVISNIISIIDVYIGIPISVIQYTMLYVELFILTCISAIYLHHKHR